LNSYRRYFEYQRGALESSIDYLNADPSHIRTLISEDPSIVFNGAVNDVVANTHTLLVAAIAPTLASAASDPPVIVYAQPVGSDAPLYSLNSQTAVNQVAVPASSSGQYVGSISIVGGAATYSSQTYGSQSMTASATTTAGEVTFSIWNPATAINFILTTYASNGDDLIALYNGNLASLSLFGSSNFVSNPNIGSAVNQWSIVNIANALGYVPPSMNTFGFILDAGSLREALDYHADQLQMLVDARILATGITIASADEVARAISSVMKSTKTSDKTLLLESYDGAVICSVDEYGDSFCGEN
jgi:hypothetical protein